MDKVRASAEDKAEVKKMADDLLHAQRHKISVRDKKEFEKSIQKLLVDNATLNEALGMTKEREDYIYSQGCMLFQSGKYKDALSIFTFLYTFDTQSYNYLFSIAACQQHLKEYDEAGGNYMLCSEIDPSNPVPYFHRYDCFKNVNNPWAAFFMLLNCIELCKIDKNYAVLQARAELELEGLKKVLEKWAEEHDKNIPKNEEK